MNVSLGNRTEKTVGKYFEMTKDPTIRYLLPQKAKTVEEAVEDYKKTLLPGASSRGRTILADGAYVGDVWCFCIDPDGDPQAMLSYCVFEKDLWNKGIASAAVCMFLDEIADEYGLRSIGAFTYSDNVSSIRVLEKNGFVLNEEFEEDGRMSKYFRYDRPLN